MPGILLSGPAGANKSDAARRRIAGASEPTVAADFQAIFVALTLQRRDPATGLYPTRTAADAALFPLVEYVRTTITRQAQEQGFGRGPHQLGRIPGTTGGASRTTGTGRNGRSHRPWKANSGGSIVGCGREFIRPLRASARPLVRTSGEELDGLEEHVGNTKVLD